MCHVLGEVDHSLRVSDNGCVSLHFHEGFRLFVLQLRFAFSEGRHPPGVLLRAVNPVLEGRHDPVLPAFHLGQFLLYQVDCRLLFLAGNLQFLCNDLGGALDVSRREDVLNDGSHERGLEGLAFQDGALAVFRAVPPDLARVGTFAWVLAWPDLKFLIASQAHEKAAHQAFASGLPRVGRLFRPAGP